MDSTKRSTDNTREPLHNEAEKDRDRAFEPPAITKLGRLTRIVKQSGTGTVTIGAGVG